MITVSVSLLTLVSLTHALFMLKVEIPSILKLRKQLNKSTLDMDSAKSRYIYIFFSVLCVGFVCCYNANIRSVSVSVCCRNVFLQSYQMAYLIKDI